jgi:hypothetical protein
MAKRILSPEMIRRMSEAHLGNTGWWKGKKRPEFSGINHPRWKGGRTITKFGYIQVLRPEHPFCNNMGYVMEHRLIMEKYLGRYLKPKEVVHHINGITGDNRLKNLMLFPDCGRHSFHHFAKPCSP